MKVLITGGAGMIGFNIAKRYAAMKDCEVTVMDNLERSELLGHDVSSTRRYFNVDALEDMGVLVLQRDVSDPDSWYDLDEYDYIFHMAAQCGVPTSVVNPRRDFEVNTIGTFNMLEHARKSGSKVVYASTNKVYPIHDAWTLDGDMWRWENDEYHEHGFPVVDDIRGSRTPYGNSKYMGDLLCQEYHHMYGLQIGVFRMSCIYGPNQFSFEEQGWITWFAIANLKEMLINIYGDGYQVRDILWVEDVVDIYHQFMESSTEHGVWNLGGGENQVTLKQAMEIISRITGKEFVKVNYADWRPSDQKVYTTDIRPLRESFGWAPTVGIEEGIFRMISWVKGVLEVF